MGGTDPVVARGADAVLWNPALLGMADAPRFSVRLFDVGAHADNNSFSVDQYNLLRRSNWTADDKSEILNSVPADGLKLKAAALGGFGVSVGRYGLYLNGQGAGDVDFGRDGLDIALNGTQLNHTYDVGGSNGELLASARVVLAASRPVLKGWRGSSALGLQVTVERGLRWEEANTVNGRLESHGLAGEALGDFDLREGTTGTGFSLGVGFVHETIGSLRMTAMVRDLLSVISWSGSDRHYHLQASAGLSGSGKLDTLLRASEAEVPKDFTTHRAPLVSLGVTRGLGPATGALLLEKGLGESPGVSSQVRVAGGLELHSLGPLALRAGLSTGGDQGTWISGGLGLHIGPWGLDLGVASRGLGGGSRGFGLEVGSSIGT